MIVEGAWKKAMVGGAREEMTVGKTREKTMVGGAREEMTLEGGLGGDYGGRS